VTARCPLNLRAAQSDAVRGYLARLALENMADPAPLVAVLGDPDRCRFFARVDSELRVIVDTDVLVDVAAGDWRSLKSIPADWLVIGADISAALDAAVASVDIPDTAAGLL